MNQVPVKWAHPDNLRQWQNSIDRIPVVPLSALREVVEEIVGQAHGAGGAPWADIGSVHI